MEGITVDRLFRCVKEVELAGRKLTVRALSDIEMQMRYRAALLEKMRVVQALKNKDSDEYKLVYLPLEEATDDQLRATLFSLKRRDFVREAEEEIVAPYIPFPDNATKEEEVEVLENRDKALKDANTARVESVKAKLEAYRELLKNSERDKLLPQAQKIVVDNYSEGEFQDEFLNQTLFLCMDGQLTLEDVRNLSTQAKSRLMQAFVEVNDLDPLAYHGGFAMASLTDSSHLSATEATPSLKVQ